VEIRGDLIKGLCQRETIVLIWLLIQIGLLTPIQIQVALFLIHKAALKEYLRRIQGDITPILILDGAPGELVLTEKVERIHMGEVRFIYTIHTRDIHMVV
jgi:hypothetical protein